MAHKAVTGVLGDSAYTILQNRPGEGVTYVVVRDDDYRPYFSPEDRDAVIGEDLERDLAAKYSNITYIVNVRVNVEVEGTTGGTQPFRVSREIFNRMRLEEPVRFRVSGSSGIPRITRLE